MEIDDKLRDSIAREIKKTYTEKKSQLLGRQWKPSARHQGFSLWQQAANQAISLTAPPEAYVKAAFTYCRMTTGPFPNNLGGPAAAGWWKQYVNNNPGYREEYDKLQREGLGVSIVEPPAITEIKSEMKHVRESLYRMTNEYHWPPLGPESLEIVRSEVLIMRPHIRLILSYPDEKVLEYFGDEILHNFARRPDILRAMETLGYPMQDILVWLNRE